MLYWYQAVKAVLRNYTVIEKYCKTEFSDTTDPVVNYCYKTLSDSKFQVTLAALGDVLGELTQLSLSYQSCNLTVLFICKLCDHLGFHFPEEDLKEWSALASMAMCVDPHSKLMFELNASMSKMYEAILHHPHSMEAINSEYAEFRYIVKQKQGSINTFSDMVATALRCEELKESSQLVDICATFQAFSADCEGSFILMNHIKQHPEIVLK